MKKILTLVFIGFVAFSVKAQEAKPAAVAADPNAPVIEFESDVIDYGKIDQGADGVRVFKFKNTGKSPITIARVQSSCGCTVPQKPEAPILPGQSGEIKVKYDTNRIGGFSKEITVFSNASEPQKKIRIKGIITKAETPVAKDKPTVSSK